MVFLYFLLLTCLVIILMLLRNQEVLRYRLKVLNLIHDRNMRDIHNAYYLKILDTDLADRFTRVRFEKFEEITYDQMFYKVWKSVDSFYDLKDLLDNPLKEVI